MMVLRTSPPSPFGRKVRISAAIAGLTDRIRIVETDTNDASCGLSKQNPLGKIPVLVLATGASYFDSSVIVEYFETSAAALMREQELEDLLIAARGSRR